MGWTNPYPVLSQKRPTADLVSRKVLVPLLGQIAICVLTQLVAFQTVQLQPWCVACFLVGMFMTFADFSYRFQPPRIDLDESNIENSENTVLFLVSSFQYILSSVVLSVGPPFRKPMSSNSWCPLACPVINLLTAIRTIPLYDSCGSNDLLLHAFQTITVAEKIYAIDIPAGRFRLGVVGARPCGLLVLLDGRKTPLP